MRLFAALLTLSGCSSCHPPPGGSDAGLPDLAGVDLAGADLAEPSSTIDFGTVSISALTAAHNAFVAGATSIDLDGDGRAEYHRTLAGGVTTSEAIDVDGDGTDDLIWDYLSSPMSFKSYRGGALEFLVEVLPNGAPDAFDYTVTRYSLDPMLPDRRELYTLDPAVDPVDVTQQEDAAHDGSWTDAGGYLTSYAQPYIGGVSFDGSCTQAEMDALNQAFDDAAGAGAACLSAISPGFAKLFELVTIGANINVSCSPTPPTANPPPCAETTTSVQFGSWGTAWTLGITLYPSVWSGGCSNPGGLPGILFHEILHAFVGHHIGNGVIDGNVDPLDQVWGCQRFCFSAMPTREKCASCLGTNVGDKRCGGFPPKGCPPDVAYCACPDGRTQLYSDVAQCNVDCPTGLKCFGFQCTTRSVCP